MSNVAVESAEATAWTQINAESATAVAATTTRPRSSLVALVTTASSATRHEITAEIQIEKSVPTSLRAGLPTIAAAQAAAKIATPINIALLVDIDPLMMSAVQTPNATIVAHAMN
jgi:hypothetical protein